MNGLIYTGGEWPEQAMAQKLAAEADLAICCDGAADKARAYGLTMDVLLGDMDSIAPETLQKAQTGPKRPKILRLPVEKDWTDTEYAVSYALEQGCTHLVFCGGLGERMDHSLGQIQILYSLCKKKVPHALYAKNTFAVAFDKAYAFDAASAQTFSLLPFGDNCCITIAGAKYPLSHHPLPMGKTLGVSNQAVAKRVEIWVHTGAVLLLVLDRV